MKTILLLLSLFSGTAYAVEMQGHLTTTAYCEGRFAGKSLFDLTEFRIGYDAETGNLTLPTLTFMNYQQQNILTWQIKPRKIGFYAQNSNQSIKGILLLDPYGDLRKVKATQTRVVFTPPPAPENLRLCVQTQLIHLKAVPIQP